MTAEEINLEQAAAVLRRVTTSIITNPNLGRSGGATLSEIFETLVSGARDLMGFDQCALFLYDESENVLVLRASKGLPEDWKDRKLKLGEGSTGVAVRGKKPYIVPNRKREETRAFRDADDLLGSGAYIPLMREDEVIGTANFYTRGPHEYTDQEVDLLVSMTNCVATAIAWADMKEKLRNREVERMYTYYRALEFKSEYHKGHVDRVIKYACKIGNRMGIADSEMKELIAASRVHDVGKVGIKDSILDSPGDLSPEQFEEIKRHPRAGADFIRQTSPDISKNIIDGVEYHHECFNGSGYPEGLEGENIPLMARIIAVADGFDAMTSARPYKDPMPVLVAVEELKRCSGMEYDKGVLIVYRVLEMMKRDESVPEEVRLSIGYRTLDDLERCSELPEVKKLVPRYVKKVTKEGARHNPNVSKTIYDPEVTQKFLETRPEKYVEI